MAVEVLSDGAYDCRECDDKLKDERGCQKKGIVPFYIDNECFFRCPLTLISEQTWFYIKAYSLYEKGILPNGNAWAKESHKFIQAMMLLENEFAKGKMKKCRTQN